MFLLLSCAVGYASAFNGAVGVLRPPRPTLPMHTTLPTAKRQSFSQYRGHPPTIIASAASDERLPTALTVLQGRVQSLCCVLVAFPFRLLSASFFLTGGLLMPIAQAMLSLVPMAAPAVGKVASLVTALATSPLLLVAIILQYIGKTLRSTATSIEKETKRLVPAWQGAAETSAATSSALQRARGQQRTAGRTPKSAGPFSWAQRLPASAADEGGRELARRQLLERAKLPTSSQASIRRMKELHEQEEIAERARANQAPVSYTVGPARTDAGDSDRSSIQEVGEVAKPTPPATVGEAKAQLAGGTRPVSTPTAGTNKWLWKGATAPTPSASGHGVNEAKTSDPN
jgi:hypothetical protein